MVVSTCCAMCELVTQTFAAKICGLVGTLWFIANDGVGGKEVHVTDGTLSALVFADIHPSPNVNHELRINQRPPDLPR